MPRSKDVYKRQVSDGGEGFLDVFSELGTSKLARVTGPLGSEVVARWVLGRDPDNPARPVAFVESALAIGLPLVAEMCIRDRRWTVRSRAAPFTATGLFMRQPSATAALMTWARRRYAFGAT